MTRVLYLKYVDQVHQNKAGAIRGMEMASPNPGIVYWKQERVKVFSYGENFVTLTKNQAICQNLAISLDLTTFMDIISLLQASQNLVNSQ